MKLVLVTGAGASRALGRAHPMPLMPDWSNRLIDALDSEVRGLAGAVGLRPGMDGQQFEEALGTFLSWRETRKLREQFKSFGGPEPGSLVDTVQAHYHREDERVQAVLRVLNETLYDLFGARALDQERARAAYKSLFERLGASTEQSEDRWVIGVTTNYDVGLEVGIGGVGMRPDAGFEAEAFGATPMFRPRGLIRRARKAKRVPVLHLHGAVGWYEREGQVVQEYADRPYTSTFGTPVVLYPDPKKEPTRDALVTNLWAEFQNAIDEATHVLVIGHSLHDAALLNYLRRASSKVATVVYHEGRETVLTAAFVREENRVTALLPDGTVIPGDFGPDFWTLEASFDEWVANPSARSDRIARKRTARRQ